MSHSDITQAKGQQFSQVETRRSISSDLHLDQQSDPVSTQQITRITDQATTNHVDRCIDLAAVNTPYETHLPHYPLFNSVDKTVSIDEMNDRIVTPEYREDIFQHLEATTTNMERGETCQIVASTAPQTSDSAAGERFHFSDTGHRDKDSSSNQFKGESTKNSGEYFREHHLMVLDDEAAERSASMVDVLSPDPVMEPCESSITVHHEDPLPPYEFKDTLHRYDHEELTVVKVEGGAPVVNVMASEPSTDPLHSDPVKNHKGDFPSRELQVGLHAHQAVALDGAVAERKALTIDAVTTESTIGHNLPDIAEHHAGVFLSNELRAGSNSDVTTGFHEGRHKAINVTAMGKIASAIDIATTKRVSELAIGQAEYPSGEFNKTLRKHHSDELDATDAARHALTIDITTTRPAKEPPTPASTKYHDEATLSNECQIELNEDTIDARGEHHLEPLAVTSSVKSVSVSDIATVEQGITKLRTS